MGMPWNISKGTILENLEQVLNNPQERDESDPCSFLAVLKDRAKPLLGIWKQKGILSGNWHFSHMEQHWFNPQGWWKDGDPQWHDKDSKNPQHHYVQPLDGLFREGLIKALELAIEESIKREGFLYIDCYWICAAHPHFEIDICLSNQQMTFILLSPNVPDEGRHNKANRSLNHPERIWVVQRKSQTDADATVQGSVGAVTKAVIHRDEGETKIVVEQLRNFPPCLPKGLLPPSDAPAHDHENVVEPHTLQDDVTI